MLKKILGLLGIIVGLLLLIPLILSSKMLVTRSAEMQVSASSLHSYLADLNHYPSWNPFSENDPGATNQITGAGVGSVLTWKGDKTGEGKMTITQIQPNQSIHLALDFYTPMEGHALIEWKTEAIDATKSRLTWSMDQDLSYFHRYIGLFMNGMIGKTFDRGLLNLKKKIEKA